MITLSNFESHPWLVEKRATGELTELTAQIAVKIPAAMQNVLKQGPELLELLALLQWLRKVHPDDRLQLQRVKKLYGRTSIQLAKKRDAAIAALAKLADLVQKLEASMPKHPLLRRTRDGLTVSKLIVMRSEDEKLSQLIRLMSLQPQVGQVSFGEPVRAKKLRDMAGLLQGLGVSEAPKVLDTDGQIAQNLRAPIDQAAIDLEINGKKSLKQMQVLTSNCLQQWFHVLGFSAADAQAATGQIVESVFGDKVRYNKKYEGADLPKGSGTLAKRLGRAKRKLHPVDKNV